MSVIIMHAHREDNAERLLACEMFTQHYEARTIHTQEEVHRYLECNPLKDASYVAWSATVILMLLFLAFRIWRTKK